MEDLVPVVERRAVAEGEFLKFEAKEIERRVSDLDAAARKMVLEVVGELGVERASGAELHLFRSETHHRAESVTRIVCGDGRAYFHKPRKTSVAQPLELLLNHLHNEGLVQRVKLPLQHQHVEYLWAEEVDEDGSPHDDALAELCAFAWVVGAVDLHRENIAARDGDVYLLDEETAIHPTWANIKNPDVGLSPLRCGVFEVAGLRAEVARSSIDSAAHVGRAFRKQLAMFAHLEESTWHELLIPFSDSQSRVVLRPTRYYASLREQGITSDVDKLREELSSPVGQMLLPSAIIDSEIEDLRRGDFPAFKTDFGSRSVVSTSTGFSSELPFDYTSSGRIVSACTYIRNARDAIENIGAQLEASIVTATGR